MHRTSLALLSILSALALLGAGCGDDPSPPERADAVSGVWSTDGDTLGGSAGASQVAEGVPPLSDATVAEPDLAPGAGGPIGTTAASEEAASDSFSWAEASESSSAGSDEPAQSTPPPTDDAGFAEALVPEAEALTLELDRLRVEIPASYFAEGTRVVLRRSAPSPAQVASLLEAVPATLAVATSWYALSADTDPDRPDPSASIAFCLLPGAYAFSNPALIFRAEDGWTLQPFDEAPAETPSCIGGEGPGSFVLSECVLEGCAIPQPEAESP